MIPSAEWLPQIATARNEEELVQIVRNYVIAWPAPQLASVPAHCRVALVSTGQEISFAAVTLVQCELKGGMEEGTAQTVRLMADVFVAAQNRLRELLARQYNPGATSSS